MRTLAYVWRRFAESVSVVAFATMFAGFVIGVIARYVFNEPISWTNELCLVAYVWIVFWSSEILVTERQHIIFDVLYGLFPIRLRRLAAIFVTSSLALVFLAALPGTVDYIGFLHNRRTTLLHLPMQLVFGAFLIFLVAATLGAIRRLLQLVRPGWQQHI